MAIITDAESIEWGKKKSADLVEGPYYIEAVKLHHLAKYAERLQAENERLRVLLKRAWVSYDDCPYQMGTDDLDRLEMHKSGFLYRLDDQATDDALRLAQR